MSTNKPEKLINKIMPLDVAPVIVFAYKRKEELEKTITALSQCTLAEETDLFVFSDGSKTEKDIEKVMEVREYIQNITGFKKVTYFFSDKNKGLGKSIIEGVTKIFDHYASVIVLEDDLLASENFLQYMNSSLNHYQNENKVFSISGYNYPFKIKKGEVNDVYFLPRPCSTGWGTWKNRWQGIDWEMKDFEEFSKDKKSIAEFKKGGTDIFGMLKRQQAGKIDSWAIRWSYHQHKINALTAYPILSKIKNIGFSNDATNSNIYNKYASSFDMQHRESFTYPPTVQVDIFYQRQLLNFYSIQSRIKNKILTYLCNKGIIKNKE